MGTAEVALAGPGATMPGVTAELIERAKSGDGDAFRDLVAPHEAEPEARYEASWNFYLPSLRDYVETGAGRPYPAENTQPV